MFFKLASAVLLAGVALVSSAPQEDIKSAPVVRPTRQVLPSLAGYPAVPTAAGYPAVAPYPTGVYGGFRRPSAVPIGHVGGPEGHAAIVGQVQDGPDPEGNFHYAFQTENGIQQEVSGQVINPGTEAEGVAQRGSYSYTSPEGIPITVNWYADDTGFHAEGEHLPRQPIVPTGPDVGPYGGYGRGIGIRPVAPLPIGVGVGLGAPGLIRPTLAP